MFKIGERGIIAPAAACIAADRGRVVKIVKIHDEGETTDYTVLLEGRELCLYEHELISFKDAVVEAAQFACSPEGHKPGSGAMGSLKKAVITYNEAQASE